ncbi:MAG TPA: iron-containing alcohol dehydrogenase family protein [Dehalococcoidia bacterium]|nr:iron-containing alcohol dehydrogenase family protein [Dehalococcoidia bacterium]
MDLSVWSGPHGGAVVTTPFRSVAYPTRVLSGPDAVEHLGAEARRLGCSRAFVVSGRSTGSDHANRGRIVAALGGALAGWYAGIEKDSTYRSVSEATAEARAASADMIVAVGGGSVIVGARAVAIFLAEAGDPFELMTQYPKGQPAVSPRLEAPKPPIINVVTTPNTAMNRAGTGLKNDDLDHRMEYFDPKTRPVAIIWDDDLIMATPPEVYRSTATTIFNGAVMGLGSASRNPLVEGDRLQSFRLAVSAYPMIGTEGDGADSRMDLMIVAFLSNRIGDVTDLRTGRGRPDPRGRAYALATALHLRYHGVGQGEATAMINPTVLERYPPAIESLRPVATGLDLGLDDASAGDCAEAIAGALRSIYRSAGMPTRLRDLDVPREDLDLIAADTQKNFNANPGMRDQDEVSEMRAILEAAW